MPDEFWVSLPDWFWYPVVFGYGAIVGSFLNVVIYRLPMGKHLSKPPSTCPNCGYKLGFWDNIPLLSFLFLGGRCRLCREPISWRYFCVELLTACLWTLLYHRIGERTGISWVDFVGQALFASVLIALVFIDLDHFIAPDELNVVATVIAVARDIVCVALAFMAVDIWPATRDTFLYFGWLPRAIAGAAAYGGALFLVSLLGFVYYAREPGENPLATAIRYFRYLTTDEETLLAEEAKRAEEATLAIATNTVDSADNAPRLEMSIPPADIRSEVSADSGNGTDAVEAADNADTDTSADETTDDEPEPPRLRFSPAFLCGLSALAMFPMIGGWSLLFFVLPLAAFLALTRRIDGAGAHSFARFFRADDLGLPGSASEAVQDAEAAADAFAKEAESGQHGGMGFGDVKLAIAVGALLGPGLALLSLFFATFFGAITGIVMASRHGRSLRYGVPFVPFMAAGAIVVMLYGHDLIGWYANLVNPQAAPTPAAAVPYRPRRAR